jgi:hypothetical protein
MGSLRERLEQLATQCEALQEHNARLAAERERYRELYLRLLEQCKRLERGLIAGQKAERLSPADAQLTLAILGALLERPSAAEETAAQAPAAERSKPPRAKPTGRKALPEHLPTVEIEIVPDEVQREGLDAYVRIGEEVCDTVEKRPASLVRVHVVRPKFVRKDRERPGETATSSGPQRRRAPRDEGRPASGGLTPFGRSRGRKNQKGGAQKKVSSYRARDDVH